MTSRMITLRRPWFRRLCVLICGVMSLAIVMTACGGAISPPSTKLSYSGKPRGGGTLTLPGVNGVPSPDLSWLQPGYNVGNDGISVLIQGSLFLTPPKVGGKPVPDLATGYSYKDDNKALTINLRPGVKFSDGTPLNAAAIVWNWGPAFDRNPASKAAVYLTGVQAVKAVNDLTVEVDFSAPNTTFLSALESEPVGLVASPTAFQKEGAIGFDQLPVGAGPYVLQSHVPNQSLVLTKNPNYWDAKHVYLKTIKEVLTGTNPTSNYQSLETQEVNLLGMNIFSSTPEIIREAINNRKLAHSSGAGTSWAFVDFTNSPPFNDKRAREALFYCTNRGPIANNILEGYAEPTYVWGGPADEMNFYPVSRKTGKATPEAGKALNPYLYNPRKAKQLVQQLGGLKFTLTSDISPTITTAVQQEWAQCGIQATINFPPTAEYTSILENGTYQAYLVNTGGVSDPRLFAKYITPAQVLDQQNEVNDPVVTKAWNDSFGDSGSTLQADWTTIFKQLNSDAYVLPVIASHSYTVYNPCFHDLSYFGNSLTFTHTWSSCGA